MIISTGRETILYKIYYPFLVRKQKTFSGQEKDVPFHYFYSALSGIYKKVQSKNIVKEETTVFFFTFDIIV